MEGLGAIPQRFRESWRANRHYHEFLEVNAVVGVLAAVEDVHHRNGQALHSGRQDRRRGEFRLRGCRPRRRHGHPQDGIGAELGLVGSAIDLQHQPVDQSLLAWVHAGSFGAIASLTLATAFSTPLPP